LRHKEPRRPGDDKRRGFLFQTPLIRIKAEVVQGATDDAVALGYRPLLPWLPAARLARLG